MFTWVPNTLSTNVKKCVISCKNELKEWGILEWKIGGRIPWLRFQTHSYQPHQCAVKRPSSKLAISLITLMHSTKVNVLCSNPLGRDSLQSTVKISPCSSVTLKTTLHPQSEVALSVIADYTQSRILLFFPLCVLPSVRLQAWHLTICMAKMPYESSLNLSNPTYSESKWFSRPDQKTPD